MLDNRQKIIISLLISVAILIVAFFLWLLFKPKEAPINLVQTPTSTIQIGQSVVEPVVLEPANPSRIENEKQYPLGSKQVAMIFAERYSSYSTDEPIKNIQDLQSLTTSEFYSAIISEAKNRQFPDIFYGYSAKALAANLIEVSQTKAKIAVNLQIEQTIGDGQNSNILYRTLNVNLIKLREEWKVNGASWQQ